MRLTAIAGLALAFVLAGCANSDLPMGWPPVPAPQGDAVQTGVTSTPSRQSRHWEVPNGDVERIAASYLEIVESYDGHVTEADIGLTSPEVQRREGEVVIRFSLEGGVSGEIRVSSRQNDGVTRVYVEVRQLDLDL